MIGQEDQQGTCQRNLFSYSLYTSFNKDNVTTGTYNSGKWKKKPLPEVRLPIENFWFLCLFYPFCYFLNFFSPQKITSKQFEVLLGNE